MEFLMDEDSLQLTDGFPPESKFLYVGSLNADVEPNEQEEISQKLLVDFNCAATGEETRNYAKLGEEEQVTVLLVASYR
ncbi:BnaC02g29600D [Brassica napus]|uniref:BnaC02g29600D protein n=2 Tax=Brassica TaxID=3705 RepID=A0A078GGZ0_BRANA|nr:hypothetical protein Bca52824_053987 [Brassica carinata]CDY23913.1 BnaC02g29600D [Brassica napus]